MIGTLTSSSSPSSSTKIILEDFPAGIFHYGTEILRSVPRKTFHCKLLRLDSAQTTRILKPIPLRSSPIDVSQVNIEAAETVEIKTVENSSTKTVRVRFQLRKECVFGEHFFILGDDPVFGGGLWDPGNALPMNWSDGHVWTIDLDLPVGRLVEFKFILKAMTGDILWQPDPNRCIETWETNKTIRVCEDWENAHLQMMIEEDFVLVNQEEQQYMPIVAENITQRLNTDVVSSNVVEKKEKEVLSTVQQNSFEVVAENGGYIISDESDQCLSSEPSNGALTAREANVTKEAMFTEEEVPVLVPGLVPMSDLENEDESDEPITNVSEEVVNEGKAESFPEVDKKEETKEERNEKAISVFDKSEVEEAVNGVEERHYNAAEEEIQKQLEKDIQWGRKTLYKLLSNFGLF